MSQINTTANKFDYSKVILTDPADGINLFGSPLSKIIEYDVTAQSEEYGEIVLSPPKDISKKLTSSIQLYHIHGCIHKDILFEQITFRYDGTVYDVNTILSAVAGFYDDSKLIIYFYNIPIDPHTSDDYFDIYFYLSQPEILDFIIDNYSDEVGSTVRSNWTVDAHVSIYQVA